LGPRERFKYALDPARTITTTVEEKMPGLELVTVLALVEYAVLTLMVGRARIRYGVVAPATTGDPTFERYFRVQQNTLEALLIFLPSLWIFAHRMSYWGAIILGLLFIAARAEYARGYIMSPERRSLGVQITFVVNGTLLIGSLAALLFHVL
jgi:glutathione S-transferase